MKLSFLVFLAFISTVLAFKFEDPGVPGVELVIDGSNHQKINVDENNDGEKFNFALITGVQGPLTIDVTADSQVKKLLNVQQEAISGSSDSLYLSANRLDYETMGSVKTIAIDVMLEGDVNTRQGIYMTIINLDDESPTFTAYPCSMDENTLYTAENSPCSLTISDPDGFLDKMVFNIISGSKNEKDIFELKYRTIPEDNVYEHPVFVVLQGGITLDYEAITLYTFKVAAHDGEDHPTIPLDEVPVLVQVNDMPDEPPRWDASFISAVQITEKERREIQVSATDGDIGINNPIGYFITDSSLPDRITVGNTTGLVVVDPIDRDRELADSNQISFKITAYEIPDPSSYIEGEVTLIIEDIDDNVAVITSDSIEDNNGKKLINISINERSTELGISLAAEDIDFGVNAIYSIELISRSSDYDYTKPFVIIPSRAYQKIDLSLAVMDANQLDYETDGWAIITFQLKTIGVHDESMTDIVDITINLNDINDESPIFDEEEYFATLPETATKGYSVAYVQATDKDEEDRNLHHELQGTLANSILEIYKFGGNITTKVENAFDYEKQTEVIVQILATDAVKHKATAQLTITVTDVNDENPVLHVNSLMSVKENQPDGTEIESNIAATDIDTVPYLEFSINWDKSYATKNSIRLSDEAFAKLHWVNVETVREEGTNNSVTARLTVTEVDKDNTPDFELFDSMYINLVVTDSLTEVAGKEKNDAMIVISIIDINDNPPIFAEGTEEESRNVIENSVEGTVITSVYATDPDVGDNVTYSIESYDDSTPLWVTIVETTGTIKVHLPEKQELDCDLPPRDYLVYTVTAHDGDPNHDTSATIKIYIRDQNENAPTMDEQKAKHIDELVNGDMSHNGDVILEIHPEDIDRDEPFHTVECKISPSTTNDVINRFKIENNTIILSLAEKVNLDREEIESFSFELSCKDDPTGQGPVSNPINPPPKISIILDDINDNRPTIKDLDTTVVSENVKKGIIATLQGFDADTEDNGLIDLVSIEKILRYINNDDKDEVPEELSLDLFSLEIVDDDSNRINLLLNSDTLENYYGYLVLTVKLTDKGTSPLSNEVDVTIAVTKYNFRAPVFKGNDYDSPIYLQYTQTPNAVLIKFDGFTYLPNIQATDQQGDKFLIKFDIEDDHGIFKIANPGNSEGILEVVTTTFERNRYDLTVTASITDSVEGNAATSATKIISVNFFDQKTTDPTFEKLEDSTGCEENVENWSYQVPEAKYDSVAPDGLPIYYLLVEGDKSRFNLDINVGLLSILKPFDYEEQTTYIVVIQASNSEGIKPNTINETRLTLTINVTDVNDNAPVFNSHEYSGILVTTDTNNGDVAIDTVEATDIDTTSQGHLTYAITEVKASDSSIQSIKQPFLMGNQTGRITLNPSFKPSRSHKGYFTLTVLVCDEDCLSDLATVIIYLVTEANLVEFSFGNDQTTVQNATEEIKRVLDEKFPDYNANVQSAKAGESDELNIVKTNSPVYFLNKKTHEPVDAQEIKREVVNVDFFNKLKTAFASIGLTLLSFNPDNTNTENLEATLKAWLIGVSVVLGALCLILLIAFVLKTRSLNQRIDKLSNTKFGSQESGLNRTGLAAPTTNKHAVEGSNPVYNSEVDTKDIDRRTSVTSGDSDLIGVEDDEKFNYEDINKDSEVVM